MATTARRARLPLPDDALVAEIADNLRFHHAMSRKAKLRTFASFMYQATSWRQPRKVVARLECSLQPVAGETGMRQEVDIRYVVTSLEGSAQHLYENVYCQRGQMENLIKLHKAQLSSDRMSCHSATANQVRLVLHTAAKLERATYDSVAFRFIAANDHPDHDTIATFRRRFLKEIEGLFVRVLELAREMGLLKTWHGGAGRHQDPDQPKGWTSAGQVLAE
jgi:hypothetical protein